MNQSGIFLGICLLLSAPFMGAGESVQAVEGIQTHRFVWTVERHNDGAFRAETGAGEIRLLYRRGSFSLQFTAPEAKKNDTRYAYKLEGIHERWLPGGGDAGDTRLEPGEYVCRVKVRRRRGAEEEHAVSITLMVWTSPWRTPAAYVLYALLAAGVYFVYRHRRRREISKRRAEYAAVRETEKRAAEAELQAGLARARTRAVHQESKRKSDELNEAGKFQLSMLPRKTPRLPHLDIAVSIKPAVEVGGDYYDFKEEDGGVLFAVCGDATGHGLKAGAMVSVIKTLFVSDAFALDEDFNRFFGQCSATIKKMGLRNLHMALHMLRIDRYRVSLSSAGMPPVLVYRKENHIVESVLLKGPPLGAVKTFTYHYDYINMEPGDVILLFSDGLPELFNRDKEMFGNRRVEQRLKEVGTKSAGEIVEHLNRCAEKWLNYKPQDDDMTFVAIKFK